MKRTGCAKGLCQGTGPLAVRLDRLLAATTSSVPDTDHSPSLPGILPRSMPFVLFYWKVTFNGANKRFQSQSTGDEWPEMKASRQVPIGWSGQEASPQEGLLAPASLCLIPKPGLPSRFLCCGDCKSQRKEGLSQTKPNIQPEWPRQGFFSVALKIGCQQTCKWSPSLS